MRYLLPLALPLVFLASCQDDDDVPGPVANTTVELVVSDDAVFPEGIAYDDATDRLYTGSTVNGTIYGGAKTDPRLEVLSTTGDRIQAALGMEVSGAILFIAGGPTGAAYLLDLRSNQVQQLNSEEVPAGDSTFVNDVTAGSDGTAYLTNSFFPVMYRYTGGDTLETWLELDSTIIEYGASFNLNGIAITPDDRYLLAIQSNTGNLYRIDVNDKSVTQVTVSGYQLTAGDGIELDGDLLFVVRNMNAEVVTVEMNDDYSSGTVVQVTGGAFRFPTTIAASSDSLFVVNAQLDQQGPGGSPVLPFTISKFAR